MQKKNKKTMNSIVKITNSRGIAMKGMSDRFNLIQLCDEPSHLNNVGKPESLPGLTFTNVHEPFYGSARSMSSITFSGHLPIMIQLIAKLIFFLQLDASKAFDRVLTTAHFYPTLLMPVPSMQLALDLDYFQSCLS